MTSTIDEINVSNVLAGYLESENLKAVVIYVDDEAKISGANLLVIKALRHYAEFLSNEAALRLTQHPDVREALESDVLSILYTYRDHEPEEDESWESWYFAAFDLACMAVRARFRAPPVLGQGTEKK